MLLSGDGAECSVGLRVVNEHALSFTSRDVLQELLSIMFRECKGLPQSQTFRKFN